MGKLFRKNSYALIVKDLQGAFDKRIELVGENLKNVPTLNNRKIIFAMIRWSAWVPNQLNKILLMATT